MAEIQEREQKLIQYLNEAYGKEQELITALQAHIATTSRDAYKKRLKEHLKETRAQAKGLERRIKKLGGQAERIELPGPDAVAGAAAKAQATAQKAVAAAKGPLHALRGTGEAEKMLKNAKTEYADEAEEIANYNAIEALAEAVGDRDTAKLAREFRRQEERMARFLERTIETLTKAVAREEIPAAQRNGGRSRGRKSSASKGTSASRSNSPTRSKSASKSSGAAKPKRVAKAKSSGARKASGGRSSAKR